MKLFYSLIFSTCLSVNTAYAYFDVCAADVLQDVRADGSSSSILKKGTVFSGISQYNEDKKTGNGQFCEHGGYCYPRKIFMKNELVEAIRLNNCSFGTADTSDKDTIYYKLDPIRSKISKKQLERYDLDVKLSEIGMSTAGSTEVENAYFHRPQSWCAMLVRRALRGDRTAIRKLKTEDFVCN